MGKYLDATGLTYFYNQIKSKFAAASHNHSASNITSGTLPIARGGTGQTSAAATRNALGLGNTTGALPIANGGTGATTAAAARANLGIKDIAAEGADYIVETYRNGTEWYEIYKSGKIRQGGAATLNGQGNITVTLLKPYGDTNYKLIVSGGSGTGYVDNANNDTRTWDKKNTSFMIYSGHAVIDWEAEGV